MKTIKVGDLTISNESPLVLIAGSCVLEEESKILSLAERLKKISLDTGISLIFKGSYDKANKTIPGAYRGPGLEKGLKLLEKVKQQTGLPVTSDVHCRTEIDAASEVLDLAQIPAALCKQIDLVLGVAKKCKAINIKKGQFVSPWNMKNLIMAVEEKTVNRNIILTERGTLFGHDTIVNDFRSLDIMKSFGYPVVFDVSHSSACTKDLVKDFESPREFIPSLARVSAAAGIAGVFIEVHENPREALSDADITYPLEDIEPLLSAVKAVDKAVKG